MAPSVSVNFVSLATSCVGLRVEEPQLALPRVLYMGVSYSRYRAHRTLNCTQSIAYLAMLLILQMTQSASRAHQLHNKSNKPTLQ